jgi:outer membrane protein TolC
MSTLLPTHSFSFRRLHAPVWFSLTVGCCLVLGRAAEPVAPRALTIAVVKDGPSALLDGVDTAFRQEAQTLTAGRATLVYKEGGPLDAGWHDGAAAGALDAALADPAVDYVLVLGVRATVAAADPTRTLAKPVLGALIQESDLVPLPVGNDGRSTKPNFAVVALPSRATDQLAELRPAVPFTSLHVIMDEFMAPDRTALNAWRGRLAQSLGVPVTLVPAGASADDVVAALGTDVSAVFLFPSLRMNATNRAALLTGLSARKFPVLSFLGQAEVEAGALAGVLPNPRTALARRLAVNLDQLITGTPLATLPLQVTLPRQLFFNEATATAIGFAFDFSALSRATFAGRTTVAAGQPLTFTDALAQALGGNHGLRARQSATESSRQAARAAAGVLLPQVVASQSFTQIDEDRARASGGAQAETAHRGGLAFSQVLVDDEAATRLKIARETLRQAGYLEQAERLDAANDAGQAYLQLLSAQANLRVVEENFQVTQHNLELARLRQRVGTSGPEEGYRFESLSAQQRSDLAAAAAQVDRARVALNRILGVDVNTRWQPRDATLEDPAFAFTTGRVIALVRDREKLERFRAFAAVYAADHSPDLAAFEQGVKTTRLTAEQKRRSRFTPKVSASFNYSRTIDQEFAGAVSANPHGAADRNDWTFGVTASLPLFTGGSLTADARKARADLRRAELSRDGARESVMAQAQAALFAAESSYGSIAHSRRAADLAAQNLAVVQDKYERGTVSIVTLLDAQNSAFAQRQSAEAAVYTFLSDLLSFQRTLGWIEAIATPSEKEAWLRAVEQAVTG